MSAVGAAPSGWERRQTRGGRHPALTGAQLQSQRTGLAAGAAVREMLMDVTNRLTGPN
ncbi:hypothetical protein XAC3810_450033 [Xanthomonas citri pv. citri]|uniref:Uncharacterized protein n=1 Tax=Xanthomonas citri pv. citri TaxID=611301 RepID=A0A0U5FEJ8_XANCI|nr:hypothetical protein XAC9322_460031 [Xanthomonas citri pv. citri]CEE29003.1 hypothetical protein XAC3824_580030 [Xanthomonas citri pv. citri]CEE30611.1 hypothetical protein XAC1083_450031 [Xanthomonas citri pv. citri]CEE39833.1 hypothetical protein XAC3810_450033 [Xanthomonas citri pv. citri]CEE42105.1 hypothetical protein XAC902_620030 [Xanthomonas citri pv. citri]